MNLTAADVEFEALLEYLKQNCGCDLTDYKHTTLQRLRFRMRLLGISSDREYLQYLQSHDDERMALLDTVYVNVTSFFRDRDAWEYLANEIVPQIVAQKQPDESIRVWSAGCATGQEVYGLLILFAEALGIHSCWQRVQFYATDIDEAALKQARLAIYSSKDVAGIPSNLLGKYFELTEQGYIFNQKLRLRLLLGRHNLAQDAPISKIDLLVCRNTLMYFNPQIQAKILLRFHFALKERGFLFLGRKELPGVNRHIFTPVNLKHKVFAKELNFTLSQRLSLVPQLGKQRSLNLTTTQFQVWQAAYTSSPFAQLAVDLNGHLVVANEQANTLFAITPNDYSYPFQELEIGKLLVDHAVSQTFYRQHRPVTLKYIKCSASKSIRYFDIYITPIFNHNQCLLGVNLTFYPCQQA